LQIEKIAHLDKKLSTEVYRHLGQVFMEALNFDEILSSPRLLNQSPIEEYWKNRKSTKGLIALSAHMGNWELVAASAAAQSVPLSVIGREARKNSWQAVLERIRSRNGVKVIWRSDASGVKEILSSLKKGAVVAALIDQDTDVRSSVSSFFGQSAQTPIGIIELGLRSGADFVSIFSFRDHSGCYRFSLTPIILQKDTGVTEVLSQYHQHLEELIRSYPEQWAWVHKRWRTMANGERLSSKQYRTFLENLP
jgi:KDO2-lipid IV(A) lauroyltransferase